MIKVSKSGRLGNGEDVTHLGQTRAFNADPIDFPRIVFHRAMPMRVMAINPHELTWDDIMDHTGNTDITTPLQTKDEFVAGEVVALDAMVCRANKVARPRDGIEHLLMHGIRRGEERHGKAALFGRLAHGWIIQLYRQSAPFIFIVQSGRVFRMNSRAILYACAAAVFALTALQCVAAEAVNFSRDVVPILSDKCFACHGPDAAQAKGGLRLDQRDSVTKPAKSGAIAITPGKVKESELMARILTTDEDDLMPPPSSHKARLTSQQADILKRWIEQGAVWGKHWAFETPVKAVVPKGVAHPVDAFVRQKLASEKLKPAPEAAKHTLIRRVSFDLTGLPPTPEEVDAFLKDRSPDAFQKVVNRLLASEHFGERMAMWWLDAARYSDTDGFQADDTRTNWPWRDWVVGAFNKNMPFDQFTKEQFAGDLLPDAKPEQILATAFHRNHMTNGEGGRDPEESRVDYVLDRVNTMGTVWLGLTLGCTQCHSHKYDPISHADYYQMTAFFNSIDEDGKAGKAAKPYLSYQSPLAERAVKEAQQLVDERKPREAQARKVAEGPFTHWLTKQAAVVKDGFTAWHPLKASELESIEGTKLAQEANYAVLASGPNPNHDDYRLMAPVKLARVTGIKLEVLPHASNTGGGISRGKSGEFILTDIKVQVRRLGSSQIRDIQVAEAVADAALDQKAAREYGDIKGVLDDDPRNGWTTKGHDQKEARMAVFALAEPLALDADEEIVFELRHRSTLGDANIGYFRVSVTDQAGSAVRSVETAPLEQLANARLTDLTKLDEKLRAKLFEQFLADYAPYQVEKKLLERANKQLGEVKSAAGKLNVMVLAERKEARDTHVLIRGVWDNKGEKVLRGVPAAVFPWSEKEEKTRLGLANWLVSRDNPLTARVMVNNLWQMLFGYGLVRTPEDFGLQGERPTHPELLDWLAVEFMESGWDVKHILEVMATSATYRQSSV
ncbi:MAG: hypothetical protein K0Q55_2024, partial [Verrucomicrobia bacterium]|nr:hypothetical protein [Verrucomicrobiota bacterium]